MKPREFLNSFGIIIVVDDKLTQNVKNESPATCLKIVKCIQQIIIE